MEGEIYIELKMCMEKKVEENDRKHIYGGMF